jgi:hypothetical protein
MKGVLKCCLFVVEPPHAKGAGESGDMASHILTFDSSRKIIFKCTPHSRLIVVICLGEKKFSLDKI